MTLALLFPGQGSQFVGMGQALTEAHSIAADTFREADEILGFALSSLLRDGPEDELVLTKNAQPAILAHSIAALRVISARIGTPAMAAGHSLGEFSAHVAAGTISFPDALRAVRLRGELMYEAGQARPGAMAALLGLGDEAAVRVCSEASEGPESVVVTANFNSEGQIVISGDEAAVERALRGAREAGAKRVIPLSVSGAFHSPLMKPAQEGLRAALDEVTFHPPSFPIYSNVTAAPVTEASEARELLVRQLTAPVQWSASIRRMAADGADRYLELGPGSVLTGLNRRNARGLPAVAIGAPDDLAALDSLLPS